MGRSRRKKILEGIKITGVADKGKAVGRTEEGQVVFVSKAIPGDQVKVVVTKKRKGFLEGRVIEFEALSPDRIEPLCRHFGKCGGCQWQNISYEKQLEHKQQIVTDAMKRIGKIEIKEFIAILPSLETHFYRNKMVFSFSCKKWLPQELLNTEVSNREDVLGFFPGGAYGKVIHLDKCHLQYEPSNELRLGVHALAKEQGLSFYDNLTNEGFLRNLMIRVTTTGEIMLLLVVGEDDQEKIDAWMSLIEERYPEVTSLYYCINQKVNDFVLDLEHVNVKGPGYIEELLGHVKFRIGPKSFFQTNSRQAIRLFDKVVEFAGLTGEEIVYDLYTGIGSIALYLAQSAKQVVGVEEIPEAIQDAIENAQLNDIDNCIFYAGDVKDVVTKEFSERHGLPDVVITDPPRAGMHAKLIETLLTLAAPKIVYVSCNPATQARDLQLLDEKYEILKMQPVDMFPQTHHIENIALLQLK